MAEEYKRVVKLKTGEEAVVRFLEPDDDNALYDFFQRLSYDTRRFLYDDVTDRRVVDSWVRNIDPDAALPVVVEVGGKIVADATLHRRRLGPLRHVGRVRVVVEDEWQGKSIGKILIEMLEEIARETGLTILSAMLVKDEEKTALNVLEGAGFKTAAEIPGYAMDPEGNVFDTVIMLKKVEE
ncbi:MAG: GNAT family N-acetyltransferase [bacterium]